MCHHDPGFSSALPAGSWGTTRRAGRRGPCPAAGRGEKAGQFLSLPLRGGRPGVAVVHAAPLRRLTWPSSHCACDAAVAGTATPPSLSASLPLPWDLVPAKCQRRSVAWDGFPGNPTHDKARSSRVVSQRLPVTRCSQQSLASPSVCRPRSGLGTRVSTAGASLPRARRDGAGTEGRRTPHGVGSRRGSARRRRALRPRLLWGRETRPLPSQFSRLVCNQTDTRQMSESK